MNTQFSKTALEYFLEISKIPRCSGNEKAASDYLISFAEGLGFESVRDGDFNVLIKKPGTEGRENEPPVILQNHIDIVCEKNKETQHDFEKDPIRPVIDGDWIRAEGTTLGADNGAGMSIAMAVLASDNLSHPPIEALFTTFEEVGMTGATNFDVSRLQGRQFINLDSGGEGVITVSCASSADIDIAVKLDKQALPKGYVTFETTIKGLTGGHSGVDINEGLANANILMARLLRELDSCCEIYLSGISGGSMRNAIPRESFATISCKENDLDAIRSSIKQAESAFKSEFPKDGGLSVTFESAEPAESVICRESFQKILDCVLQAPNGVLAMSAHIEGLVQTSCNLGVIVNDEDAVKLLFFPRSSSSSEQADTIGKFKTLAGSQGAEIVVANEKPPW